MHYNHYGKRLAIEKEYQEKGIDLYASERKIAVYINLCIHPYTWEQTYHAIRDRLQIETKTYFALLGVIKGLLVHLKRAKKEATRMSSELAPDWIEFIRSDSVGDPWKFILSMRRYFPRYLIIRGLKDFNVDWRDMAYDVMGAKWKPQPKTFHSLLTNTYVRTIIKALGVYAAYREPHNEDYESGVNDIATLLKLESQSNKCKSYDVLEKAFEFLCESLPSWSPQVRGRTTYYLSNLLPLSYLVEKQIFGRKHENIIGTKNDW